MVIVPTIQKGKAKAQTGEVTRQSSMASGSSAGPLRPILPQPALSGSQTGT